MSIGVLTYCLIRFPSLRKAGGQRITEPGGQTAAAEANPSSPSKKKTWDGMKLTRSKQVVETFHLDDDMKREALLAGVGGVG